MESVFSLIIGAIIGYIVSLILDLPKTKIDNHLKKRRVRKTSKKLSKFDFSNDSGYMALDHAIPFYEENNIDLKHTGKEFIIEIPDKFKPQLEQFKFETRKGSQKGLENILSETFGFLSEDNDYNKKIQVAAEEVSKDFIAQLENGATRFNGKMFGVQSIKCERLTENEKAGLSIEFYITDYFTYRVFAKLYQEYKSKIIIKGIQDLKKYIPFLSSFGIANFVIASDNTDEYILLGHRSNNVIVDKNRLHFSMNEAFSLKDIDEFEEPSFKSCLFRGLKEELGINKDFKKNVVDYGFLDLGIDVNRMEMGISSYTKLKFDDNFTPETLRKLYSIAQDRELETKKLEFIPMSSLDKFINENEYKMSAGCRGTLKLLQARRIAGYL
ncbi:MAG: hypothetical protein IH595_02380 [Bacteroidales bacterium]|nr:hypothetical protein [Bacteroidales bacterium]